jgi:hypothetical protein
MDARTSLGVKRPPRREVHLLRAGCIALKSLALVLSLRKSLTESICFSHVHRRQYKLAIFAALVASASAFAPATPVVRTTAINQEIGKGGMADTRDPDVYVDEDPRKSISAAPSFEEYLKQRQAEGK